MPTLPINGAQLRVRMVEIELDRLKLDPDNPRLHTAYLTHAAAQPAERNPDSSSARGIARIRGVAGCHFPQSRMFSAAADYGRLPRAGRQSPHYGSEKTAS
jgi:hypothetical protein